MPLKRGPIWHDIAYITAVIKAEYKSECEPTKDTPYLTLTGELWGVFVRIFKKIDCVITVTHCIWYIIAVTDAEHKSELEITTELQISHSQLSYGFLLRGFGENWPCYKGTATYLDATLNFQQCLTLLKGGIFIINPERVTCLKRGIMKKKFFNTWQQWLSTILW